jgi:hypothetical protein
MASDLSKLDLLVIQIDAGCLDSISAFGNP